MRLAMLGLCKIGGNTVRRLRHTCHGPSNRLIAMARWYSLNPDGVVLQAY